MLVRKQSLIILPSFLLLLSVSIGMQTGCQHAEDPLPESPRSGPLPEQQFYDYRLIESQAGVPQWILESDKMLKFSGREEVLLVEVQMDFYQEGAHFSTLTSDSGWANLLTKDVQTWGNVIVLTDDGRRLDTEELYFSNETQLIHNDVFDRLTRGEDVVTGIGLEATPNLEYIEIKQQVQAVVGDEAPQKGETVD